MTLRYRELTMFVIFHHHSFPLFFSGLLWTSSSTVCFYSFRNWWLGFTGIDNFFFLEYTYHISLIIRWIFSLLKVTSKDFPQPNSCMDTGG